MSHLQELKQFQFIKQVLTYLKMLMKLLGDLLYKNLVQFIQGLLIPSVDRKSVV